MMLHTLFQPLTSAQLDGQSGAFDAILMNYEALLETLQSVRLHMTTTEGQQVDFMFCWRSSLHSLDSIWQNLSLHHLNSYLLPCKKWTRRPKTHRLLLHRQSSITRERGKKTARATGTAKGADTPPLKVLGGAGGARPALPARLPP